MVAFVKNANGAWNVSTLWTPNGIPGSADTVTLGAFTTFIPNGYTAQCGGITSMEGSDTSTRSTLEISGTLEMYGTANMGLWATLSFIGAGKIDLRGNAWEISYADGSGKRAEVISDGAGLCEIYSSTTIGHFGGPTAGQGYGKLALTNFRIANTSFQYGSTWYPGNGYRLVNGLFYDCGRIENDGYVDDADEWIVENVDFRGSQAPDQQKVWLYCRDKGGVITGLRRFKSVTFDYHGIADAILRVQFWPAVLEVDTVALRGCYIEAISPVLPTWNKLFSSKAGTIGEALSSIRDAVFSSTGDNPHALQNLLTDLQYFYLETQQPLGSSDAGDHFILPNGGTSLIRYGIINDNWGGACMNAIGASVTGTHTMEHCTIVVDLHDAVYGIIARNENFGVFNPAATVTIRSNIAYARSNVSGSSNVRAINLETAGNDQIDVIDHNLITGFGSNLSTIYYGVTYSSGGAVGTVVNRGLNDILNVDPQFVDETRNVQSWATQYGATDYDSAIIYVIDAVNGYNRTTHSQDGVVGHTITEMLEYLREGYSPTNAAIATAAHDGAAIGAQDLFLLPGGAFQADAFQSDAFQADSGSYTINAESGSFAVTGGNLNLIASRLITAESGSVAVTGGDLNFVIGRKITCDSGSFAVTGGDASILVSRIIAADSGSYPLAGQDLSILASRKILAESGSYSITGGDMDFVYTPSGSYSFVCDSGSFAVTGSDLSIRVSRLIQIGSGSIAVTGQDLGIIASRRMQLDSGTYALSGQDAAIRVSRLMSLGSGNFAVSGGDIGIIRSLRMGLDAGVYGITGYELTFNYSGDYTIPTDFFANCIVRVQSDIIVATETPPSARLKRDPIVQVRYGL